MANQETAIEVKVGALVLFALALLVGFVVLLGDFSFSEGFRFHVDFENAGGLKPGADVAIAGMNVGTVEAMAFRRNEDVEGEPAVEVRATLRVDEQYADAVRTSSEFYVTRRGMLGEPYIEIVTETFDAPQIEAGATLRGVSQPRMDVIVAKAANLLETLNDLLDDPNIEVKDLIANTASLMGHLDAVVVDNREHIDKTFEGASTSSQELASLLTALNWAVDDGKSVRGLLTDAEQTASNARRITDTVGGRIEPILGDAEAAVATARRTTETVDQLVTGKEPQINAAIDNLHATSDNLAVLTGDARSVVGRIESGEGTIGGLLADREMYEDMKELLRTIKRRPWKIIWKE